MLKDASGQAVATHDGRTVRLGPLIKSGGAGTVYRVAGDTASVAKLYHANVDLKVYSRKVGAMLELRPRLPELQDGDQHIVQLAWPLASIHDAQRRFLGYLMPTVDIDATSELECVLQERQARRMGLPTGLGAKVTLAANLCAVIAELHRQRHYVVDLKPVNLRFYRHALYLAMLDCDGFSIQGHGERFEAPQYTPDYLAPEFHARGLTAAGEAQQDRFALAVVVFQLLNFGIHPFTGRPQSNQVPTDIPGRIAGRWYAYGLKGSASLLPTPASGHAAMPAELRTLFDRAFDNAGASRPSADEWSTLLRGYAQRAAGKLKACARDATHQHFVGHDCAACARVQMLAGAQAAAARKPAPPRIARRPSAIGNVLARKPAPPAPAATTGRIPPNVLARINQAWAKRTPAPVRRPANWPAPPPPTGLATPGTSTTTDVWAGLIVFLIFGLFGIGSFLSQAYDDWSRDRRAIAEAPQRIAEARARQEANRVAQAQAQSERLQPPRPGWGDLDEQDRQLQVLATAVTEGNDYAVLRSLSTLRSRSRGRQQAWRQALEQARADGVDLDGVPPVTALDDAAAERQRQGWGALATGDRTTAAQHFAAAIWNNCDAADAWLGYALSVNGGHAALGASTMAILTYPDAAAARASRAAYLPRAANGDVRRLHELEVVLDRAAIPAERLRTRLPAGTVRLAEPFSWNPR